MGGCCSSKLGVVDASDVSLRDASKSRETAVLPPLPQKVASPRGLKQDKSVKGKLAASVSESAEERLDVALKQLAGHRANATDAASCFETLAELCYDPLNRQPALQRGALEASVKALRSHASEETLQQWGLALLSNLTRGDDDTGAACRLRAAKVGAIEVAVEAAMKHEDVAAVQEHACGVIGHVTMASGDPAHGWQRMGWSEAGSSAQKRAVAAGAIDAIVGALKAHRENEAVQAHGCWALQSLVRTEALKQRARDAGATEAMLTPLRLRPTSLKPSDRSQKALGTAAQPASGRLDRAVSLHLPRSLPRACPKPATSLS